MTKFNVGDRVQVVKSPYVENEELFVGAVGTVEKVLHLGEAYSVVVDGFHPPIGGGGWTYFAEELELE